MMRLARISRQTGRGGAARRFGRTTLAGWLMLVAGLLGIIGLLGCGTPKEQYKTLSVFFDGVPNPDSPTLSRVDSQGQVVKGAPRILSQHKPYQENQCSACHRSSSGEIQDFELAFGACVKCHKKVATEHTLMHGPVAREQCKWCHTPHQSTELALLRDTPIKVCTQCHDSQLLSNTPPEHVDGVTSCLTCHFGHGGEKRNFLKTEKADSAGHVSAVRPGASATRPDVAGALPGGVAAVSPEREKERL
jgi:predicted CXXCH cytochrome family protein